jgi:dTDP-4-dehydrorhamnose reductase
MGVSSFFKYHHGLLRENRMRVLMTGGTGLLGKALSYSCDNQTEITATYIGNYNMEDSEKVKYLQLDVRDKDGYTDLFKNFKPDITIHAAGIGSPDFAENNRELVRDINLDMCNKYDSKFVFISSNGIFDGNNAPYSEEDKAEPVNYYGEVKLEGEEITKKTRIPFVIVRPILMYGWQYPFERANIVTQSLSKLQNQEMVHAYNDVYAQPLLNYSCAKAIWKIIRENKVGVYNIAGAERVNIYQLITKVAEVFNLDKRLIIPVQQGYFNELAKRPPDTSFNTDKMEKELGLKPLSLDEGLSLMKGMKD